MHVRDSVCCSISENSFVFRLVGFRSIEIRIYFYGLPLDLALDQDFVKPFTRFLFKRFLALAHWVSLSNNECRQGD